MVTIIKKLVESKKYGIKCPYAMIPTYITIHNTANDASAANEIQYMTSNNNERSFHFAVDDKEVIQGIETNRNAWHSTDGNGPGNRQSIAIEICYSKSGGDRYYKAENNAAKLVAQLLKEFKLPISNVVQHNHWHPKDCPHRIRAEGRWDSFIQRVQNELDLLNTPQVQPTVSYYPKSVYIGSSFVAALNILGIDSSFNHRAAIAAKNGITGVFTGTAEQNTKMLNLLRSGKLIK